MSSKALVGWMLLGVVTGSAGLLELGSYLHGAAVYVGKENVTLTGPGALTVPLAKIGGGVATCGWCAAGWLRKRRASAR